MSTLRDELEDLKWNITKLRWVAAHVSPATEELLKAAERLLAEELKE